MAHVLPVIEDQIVALLEGTASGIARSVAAGRFKHIPYDPQYALPMSIQAPYPFEIVDNGEHQPLSTPSTVAHDQVWHGVHLLLRVAYTSSPHDGFERQKTIQRDRYSIRRCLGDPDSFDGVTGFAGISVDEGQIRTAVLPGYEAEESDIMHLLEVPLDVVYREDQTT